LFSESVARVLVTVAPEDEERLFELATEHGVPVTSLGVTRAGDLTVTDLFDVPLAELRATWSATLPAALA
jgi:phosphoribosylformylglycinamidine (FGAM) synthase-like enzyme